MGYKILKDNDNTVSTNTYLIYDENTKDAWMIDAPDKTKQFIDFINEKNLNLKYIVLTHGHWDHIKGLDFFRNKYKAKVVAFHKSLDYLENPNLNLSYNNPYVDEIITKADIYLYEKEGEFDIFKYYYTPGHSYDHIIYKLDDKIVFCGDLIFYLSVGRTDFAGSSFDDLKKSILDIIYTKFDDKTLLLPGHGVTTQVEFEKMHNPFVPFREGK